MTEPADLDNDLRRRVAHLADLRHQPADALLREAVAQYVEREEKREAFVRDAVEAARAYEADGLHLTLEEAEDWLRRLEAGEDADPPACHG